MNVFGVFGIRFYSTENRSTNNFRLIHLPLTISTFVTIIHSYHTPKPKTSRLEFRVAFAWCVCECAVCVCVELMLMNQSTDEEKAGKSLFFHFNWIWDGQRDLHTHQRPASTLRVHTSIHRSRQNGYCIIYLPRATHKHKWTFRTGKRAWTMEWMPCAVCFMHNEIV